MPANVGGVNHPIDSDAYAPTGTTAGAGDLGRIAASVAQKAADEAALAGLAARQYADQQDTTLRARIEEVASHSGTSGTVTADDVDSGAASSGLVLTADGSGGADWAASSGSGGTTDHRALSNRSAADQHPIGAITGLQSALDGKQAAGSYAAATHSHTASQVSDSTVIGRALLTAADAAAARTAIGAGTSSLQLGTTAATAKAGNWVPSWSEVTAKPGTFPPTAHTHATSEVTGLDAALASKASYITLGPSDPVPPGTPAGTLVFRTA